MAPMKPVHPDIDWQADMLAAKVLRRAMTLKAAASELDEWQSEAGGDARYRDVDSRALIVTHALNALLRRGY